MTLGEQHPAGTRQSRRALMPSSIYLDYQSTTPVDPRVLEAMLPYFSERFANPASVQHAPGLDAAGAVEHAREQVARLLRADRSEVFFLSGATEANNLALKGLADRSPQRRHLISVATEHHAVLDTLETLGRRGFTVTLIAVDREGQPDLDELEEAVNDETLIVTVAAANNEIGTLPPLQTISEIAHARGALIHTDAAQAVGKIDLDVRRDGIDLLSVSAHKLYGPKGVGALLVGREHQGRLAPLLDGGAHERGLRSGTVNVPGVIGLGAAAEIAGEEMPQDGTRLAALRDRFRDGLHTALDDIEVNGPQGEQRLPGNLNLRFRGVDAEALIANCPEVAFSAGSACSSATPAPSHVLIAIGRNSEEAEESARFGFGRPTTNDDIDRAIELLVAAATRVRVRSAQPVGTR
jgi:cysteine desulfurase